MRVEYFQSLMDVVVLGFLSQPQIPELIQGFGAALLTILVAVAIFLIQSDIAFDFDRQVIVEEVVKFRQSLISVLLIFTPLFFWGKPEATSYLRIGLFLMSLSGLFVMIYVLRRSYKWINVFESEDLRDVTGYRMKARLRYLGSLKEAEKKVAMWSSVWKKESKSFSEERVYIETFAKWIEALVSSKDEHSLYIAGQGIQRLEELSEHISFSASDIFKELFQSLLQINQQVSPIRGYDRRSTETKALSLVMGDVIPFLAEKALQNNNASVFFNVLSKHLEQHSEEGYVKRVIQGVAFPFFDNVATSGESHYIWEHHFPKEWKISKETSQDKDNFVANVWLDRFLVWSRNRVREWSGNQDGVDESLDNVSRNLFPTVCPITWAMILLFVSRALFQVKLLIERPKMFGHHSHIKVSWGPLNKEEMESQSAKERDNAVELALLIFHSSFTKEKINGYMEQLESLEYEEGSWQLGEKERIRWIFEDMLKLLDQQETEGETKT